jgi:hypothetical protein
MILIPGCGRAYQESSSTPVTYAVTCACGTVSQVIVLENETLEHAKARALVGACTCGAEWPNASA